MQIYDKLLGIPLFQGMSSGDLQEVVTKVKFGFDRYRKKENVVRQGMPCKALYFLLDGELEVLTRADDDSFLLTETLQAPAILQPERLFGLDQHYTRSYTATQTSHLLTIRKDDILLLADLFLVFRINLLNLLTHHAQKLESNLLSPAPLSLREHIMRFLREHSSTPSGEKVMRIKMVTLAQYLHASRLDVSVELNAMHDEGLIRLQRGMITYWT